MEARAEGRERISVIDPPTKPGSYFPLDSQAEQWIDIWNGVSAMNRLAEENGVRFLLLLFPLEFQVVDKSYSTMPQELLTTKAAEAGIPAAVMVAPVIPGLNDPEIESILSAASAAGATEAGYILLRLPLEV